MTIIQGALSTELGAFLGKTLFDVREAIAIRESLDDQVRRNLISNINTVCRVLDRRPQDVPASLNLLRPMLDVASPGAIHVSPRNWQNVKSGVTRAINLCGFNASFIPKDIPIAECWLPVIAHVDGPQNKWSMRRFAKFCSARQIAPKDVADDLVPEYVAYLKDIGSKAPTTCRGDLVRTWNCISAANPELNLATLSREKRSRTYSRTWNELPPSLAADAAAFKAAILHVDLFARNARKPVRLSTADQYDRQIRRLASACLLSGATEDQIGSLACLVSPAMLRLGLTYLWPKGVNTPNQQVNDMAHLALLIGSTWAKLPDGEITELTRMARTCKVNRRGLAKKAQEGLRQFRDSAVIANLVQLPDQLLAKAQRLPLNCRSAILVQTAVAIAILTHAPVRIKNLRSIDRTRHFVPMFSTKEPGMQLVFPKEEVKNDVDLEYPLPAATMALVEIYMRHYQPLLSGDRGSTFLFPGRGGKSKSENTLRRQIIKAVWKHIGLRIYPHLFRHLAAFIFLHAHPGCYEDVRRLLGHKSIQTTINFYAGLETTSAATRYNAAVASYQVEPKKERR